MKHSDLPQHCSTCGIDWPPGYNGTCRECRSGLPCRADTTDPVAPDPPCAGSRGRLSVASSVPVDLRADGVLWAINKTLFHPRGYALAVDETGELSLMGDGREPWTYDHEIEFVPFDAFAALLARAAEAR